MRMGLIVAGQLSNTFSRLADLIRLRQRETAAHLTRLYRLRMANGDRGRNLLISRHNWPYAINHIKPLGRVSLVA